MVEKEINKWWSINIFKNGRSGELWEQLPPDARNALDAYLAHRERRLLAIAGVTLPLIAAVIAFSFQTISSNAANEARTSAISTTESLINGNALQERLRTIRENVDKEREFVRTLNQNAISDAARGQTLAANAATQAQEVLKSAEQNAREFKEIEKQLLDTKTKFEAKLDELKPIPGPVGPRGPKGDIGPKGDTGPQGVVGPQGERGPEGPQGAPGSSGSNGNVVVSRGPIGPQGPQGPRGFQGEKGPQGESGPVGPRGAAGKTGPEGPAGVAGKSLPQGAVVAFDLANGCPDGWSSLDQAAGRTIIGVRVGQKEVDRPYRQLGGEESFVLATNQMPRHHHLTAPIDGDTYGYVGAPTNLTNQNLAVGHPTIKQGSFHIGGQPTSESGGASSIANMPPYIALYLCRKE